jgi:hypothetical protein
MRLRVFRLQPLARAAHARGIPGEQAGAEERGGPGGGRAARGDDLAGQRLDRDRVCRGGRREQREAQVGESIAERHHRRAPPRRASAQGEHLGGQARADAHRQADVVGPFAVVPAAVDAAGPGDEDVPRREDLPAAPELQLEAAALHEAHAGDRGALLRRVLVRASRG